MYSDEYKDRQWEFFCACHISHWGEDWDCDEFTPFVHAPEEAMSFQCRPNWFIAGVRSYFDQNSMDRVWSFKCCTAGDYITTKCRLTGYHNAWYENLRPFMLSPPRVFTGMYSYYKPGAL